MFLAHSPAAPSHTLEDMFWVGLWVSGLEVGGRDRFGVGSGEGVRSSLGNCPLGTGKPLHALPPAWSEVDAQDLLLEAHVAYNCMVARVTPVVPDFHLSAAYLDCRWRVALSLHFIPHGVKAMQPATARVVQ